MQRFALFLFLLFSTACNSKSGELKEIKKDTVQLLDNISHTANATKTAKPIFSNVEQVVADTSGVYWGNYADNPTSILHFTKKGFVQIEYYGQCWYTYPISLVRVDELGRCIVMQWDDDMDCKFDIGFDKIRKNIPKPAKRERFAIFSLQNDTLFAHYLYPEWVREMNKKDTSLTLFPESFAAKEME